jgi:hypothetical protein
LKREYSKNSDIKEDIFDSIERGDEQKLKSIQAFVDPELTFRKYLDTATTDLTPNQLKLYVSYCSSEEILEYIKNQFNSSYSTYSFDKLLENNFERMSILISLEKLISKIEMLGEDFKVRMIKKAIKYENAKVFEMVWNSDKEYSASTWKNREIKKRRWIGDYVADDWLQYILDRCSTYEFMKYAIEDVGLLEYYKKKS